MLIAEKGTTTSEVADLKAMLQLVLKRLPPTPVDPVAVAPPLVANPIDNANDSPPNQNSTPGENGSTSAHHSISRNLATVFASQDVARSSSCPRRVILRNKFGHKLARGYMVKDHTSGVCHFRKVYDGERKVCIEEVFDRTAPLYDPPQNGNHTLAAYVSGGFLVWPLCHIDECE